MARWLPVVPVVGARTLFQPVYVDDVARMVCRAVEDDSVSGIYELGGPDVMSFRELMGRMLVSIRRRRFIVDLPKFIAGIAAFKFEAAQVMTGGLFVNRMLTRDQIRQLSVDNVVGADAPGLAELGIQPTSMDAVLDSYLYRFRPAGQYTAIHESAKADAARERRRLKRQSWVPVSGSGIRLLIPSPPSSWAPNSKMIFTLCSGEISPSS